MIKNTTIAKIDGVEVILHEQTFGLRNDQHSAVYLIQWIEKGRLLQEKARREDTAMTKARKIAKTLKKAA